MIRDLTGFWGSATLAESEHPSPSHFYQGLNYTAELFQILAHRKVLKCKCEHAATLLARLVWLMMCDVVLVADCTKGCGVLLTVFLC